MDTNNIPSTETAKHTARTLAGRLGSYHHADGQTRAYPGNAAALEYKRRKKAEVQEAWDLLKSQMKELGF